MALWQALELLRTAGAKHLATRMIIALASQTEDAQREVIVPNGLFLEEPFLKHGSFTDIADLIVAATAAYPTDTWSWMQRAADPLVNGSPHFGAEYAKGVILGCFQAGVWLNDNWKAETELDSMMPALIPELVLSEHLCGICLDERDQERFGGQLAEPVKQWVMGVEYRRGAHFSRVHKMLFRLDEKMQRGQAPSLLGLILLGKICYEIFGTLAPKAQAHALSLCLHELLDPITERAERVRRGEVGSPDSPDEDNPG